MGAIISGHSLVCFCEYLNLLLQWEIFWKHKDTAAYSVLAQLQVLQITLNDNQIRQVEELHQDFGEFEKCEAKAELCLLSGVWLQLVADIKSAVVSEREGPWNQLAATVEDSMPIFAECDCIS